MHAGLVVNAQSSKWSSAAAHCGSAEPDDFLNTELWNKRWSTEDWRDYFAAGETEAEIAAIRGCTHTGRPLGSPAFVHSLEQITLRRLIPQKGGRPAKTAHHPAQQLLPL